MFSFFQEINFFFQKGQKLSWDSQNKKNEKKEENILKDIQQGQT